MDLVEEFVPMRVFLHKEEPQIKLGVSNVLSSSKLSICLHGLLHSPGMLFGSAYNIDPLPSSLRCTTSC